MPKVNKSWVERGPAAVGTKPIVTLQPEPLPYCIAPITQVPRLNVKSPVSPPLNAAVVSGIKPTSGFWNANAWVAAEVATA